MTIHDSEPDWQLTVFLYILARDHLPMGVVEAIVEKHVAPTPHKARPQFLNFSNEHLEAWAKEITAQLRSSPGIPPGTAHA